MKTINEPCDIARETSHAIHVYHGHRHLEKVYETAMVNRLRKSGIDIKRQHPIQVFDEDGTNIGDCFADLLTDDRLLIELKARTTLADVHTAQLPGYFKSSRTGHGLLINFGSYKFQIKKYAMSERGPSPPGLGLSTLSEVFALTAFFRG